MSKATIIDNDLLKKEIKALYDYVNRDEYNLNVVEAMTFEIQDIIKGLKPCKKESKTSGYVNTDSGVEPPSYETSIDTTSYETNTSIAQSHNDITCPNCGSNMVILMYTGITLDGKSKSAHYICSKCHKEFDV